MQVITALDELTLLGARSSIQLVQSPRGRAAKENPGRAAAQRAIAGRRSWRDLKAGARTGDTIPELTHTVFVVLTNISAAKAAQAFLKGGNYVTWNDSSYHLDFDPHRRPPDLALQFWLGLLSLRRTGPRGYHPSHSRAAGKGLEHHASAIGSEVARPPPWRTKMITLTRRAAFIALATCVAVPAHAQTSRQNAEFMTLGRPAAFEIAPNTGSLKESVQKGQQLVWHPKDKPDEPRFQITNIAVAFLREQTGGQLKMTFAGNVSSLGYQTSEEDAKLNVIVSFIGGVLLHSWS